MKLSEKVIDAIQEQFQISIPKERQDKSKEKSEDIKEDKSKESKVKNDSISK